MSPDPYHGRPPPPPPKELAPDPIPDPASRKSQLENALKMRRLKEEAAEWVRGQERRREQEIFWYRLCTGAGVALVATLLSLLLFAPALLVAVLVVCLAAALAALVVQHRRLIDADRAYFRGLRDADVRYGWDRVEGRIETKGRKRRTVPIPPLALREILATELATGRSGDDLLFGATAGSPFVPSSLQRRADKAWKDAGLDRLTLHDCRHSYTSLSIAAGVNAKALSTYMGHASIQITFDRYGHLMPGNEGQAAGLLDAYLTGA